MRPPLPRRLRILRRTPLTRVWCLLVAFAVLSGGVHAGARYFYCEAMGLSTTDPCAQVAGERAPRALASFERARFDCCEVITMPSMPEGARSVVPTVPPAGVVAIVPPAVDLVRPPTGRFRIASEGDRWHGLPGSQSDRRALLMVFLT